jgi:hypothetical protein
MARQRNSKLEGTVGNLIFYNRLGAYCMRTKPDSVNRTKSTVHSGLNFGKASKISRRIRRLVESINPLYTDNLVRNRLNGALNKFISWKEKKDQAHATMPDNLPFVYGFQFNNQSDLTDITAIQVSVKSIEPGLTEVSLAPVIPSQSLHAPANTNRILFKMILIGTNLSDAKTDLIGKVEIEIPYSSDSSQPPVMSIPSAAKPGDLAIMVMAVQYIVNRNCDLEMLDDKKKQPCGVVWAALS